MHFTARGKFLTRSSCRRAFAGRDTVCFLLLTIRSVLPNGVSSTNVETPMYLLEHYGLQALAHIRIGGMWLNMLQNMEETVDSNLPLVLVTPMRTAEGTCLRMEYLETEEDYGFVKWSDPCNEYSVWWVLKEALVDYGRRLRVFPTVVESEVEGDDEDEDDEDQEKTQSDEEVAEDEDEDGSDEEDESV